MVVSVPAAPPTISISIVVCIIVLSGSSSVESSCGNSNDISTGVDLLLELQEVRALLFPEYNLFKGSGCSGTVACLGRADGC